MISLKRITRSTDTLFTPALHLLNNAFEPELRRPEAQLKYIIENEPRHHFFAVVYEKKIAGVCAVWRIIKDVNFIEHVVISPDMRGLCIGKKVIDQLKQLFCGHWLLEVDGDAAHEKLRKWYTSFGFKTLDKSYLQPSYVFNGHQVPLFLMGNIPQESLTFVVNTMKNLVYFNNNKQLIHV
ncbi:hypothetical protein EIN_419710 [Entamoeba invadens IP1]|uniref:N-acetyltransferase domain-containing protein n=1 Tax=Entamoeba invadens IP1 TaxID=370355 RepID=A0A0A1U5C4_ENTIV|nr:hypothetical protein EIN_419390 [Entamoeba invadens IP1]XP_004254793.1 hypothetical protein EIN_419710 [Entamoeba invadens IP1]ELP88010.1 hypothetical protein EIN_419390 [Entamoeba invadens IP1]ELP88022.1 hypothetical protein EIN_419710 [Entamoeba invadens IP1]|eukprot:XP_004254781.1 hypothetical protein EIN_419390 [Entamoeba invadens IP1]